MAIAAGIYTEKVLLPHTSSLSVKLIMRWNYSNGIGLPLSKIHPLFGVFYTLFLLSGLIAAIKVRELINIELAQSRKHFEFTQAYSRFWQTYRQRLNEIKHLSAYGCPAGYQCLEMGAEDDGYCQNIDQCRRLPKTNCQ